MMYRAYQALDDFMAPMRMFAATALSAMESSGMTRSGVPFVRNISAAYEMLSRAKLTHTRPSYEIDAVISAGREAQAQADVAEGGAET